MLSLPIVQTEEYSGVPLLFCHGTPDSYSKGILENASQTDLEGITTHPALVSGGILVCGHTHRRFIMRWGNLDVINFGAVSIPGDCLSRNARYGIIEIDQGRIVYRPREVEFDFAAYVQDMIDQDLPGRAELLIKYGLE
jgi:predicted phosphodiesterase